MHRNSIVTRRASIISDGVQAQNRKNEKKLNEICLLCNLLASESVFQCTFLWLTGLEKPINTQYWSLLDSGQ